MLNLVFAQHAIACVLCELLCLELFTVFFQHENRFRYKFFRYCSIFKVLCALALRLTTWLFYHRSGFLSSTFLRSFWTFLNLERFKPLSVNWCFSASIGSFQGLPAETSEVILLSQRLALKYNTTPRDSCQHFLTSFFQFLCGGEDRPLRRSRARFPLLSPTVTSSPGAGEVFPQRGSQAVTFVAKALGSMRKLPAVLLALPLGELAKP